MMRLRAEIIPVEPDPAHTGEGSEMIHGALWGPSYLATIPINRPLFASPAPAGRKITAGFSYLQRIGKSAAIDVWFPKSLQRRLDERLSAGLHLGPEQFPAEWAAVRQFELLQEAGNYKIYDMDATYLTRTLMDLSRNMRAGGYRVTVATIGSYSCDGAQDELEILDHHLQERLSRLIHMLYLEEQSQTNNEAQDAALAAGIWDFCTALPHVGATLGARDLFKSRKSKDKSGKDGKGDGMGNHPFTIAEKKHQLARHFFDILGLLPQSHIVHDTAIGLQLPESIAENEWIYLAPGDETLRAFNTLLTDLFAPFDKISLADLHERPDARPEIKATAQHMRGYGDRLTPDAEKFYASLGKPAIS